MNNYSIKTDFTRYEPSFFQALRDIFKNQTPEDRETYKPLIVHDIKNKKDKNTISKIINKVGYFVEDTISPGRMCNCPKCEERIILSYPTTTCGYCKYVFKL